MRGLFKALWNSISQVKGLTSLSADGVAKEGYSALTTRLSITICPTRGLELTIVLEYVDFDGWQFAFKLSCTTSTRGQVTEKGIFKLLITGYSGPAYMNAFLKPSGRSYLDENMAK